MQSETGEKGENNMEANYVPIQGKRVLVTGGDGFIGAFLIRRLIEEGARVSLILKPEKTFLRLKPEKNVLAAYHADLAKKEDLKNLLHRVKPQYVFHLAALTAVERETGLLEPLFRVNCQGTLNLMELLLDDAPERIVVAGTCEEYGDSPVPLGENSPPAPLSPYSAAKAAATLHTIMLARTFGLPAVVLRPFLTYGPFQKPDRLIPGVILHCLDGKDIPLTPGEQTREFNYVSDMAEAFLMAACAPDVTGRIINLGCGREIRIKEMVMKIIGLTESKSRPLFGALPYRPGESMRFFSDSRLAGKLLNWRPAVSLEEGLEKTVRWYAENRESLPREWWS